MMMSMAGVLEPPGSESKTFEEQSLRVAAATSVAVEPSGSGALLLPSRQAGAKV